MAYYSRLPKDLRAVCGRDYVVHVVKRFVHSASPKFNHGNNLMDEADQQCLLTQLTSLEELISSKDGLHVHLEILRGMASYIERTVLDKGASNKLKDFIEWEIKAIDKLFMQAKTTQQEDALALVQLTRRLGQKFTVDQ